MGRSKKWGMILCLIILIIPGCSAISISYAERVVIYFMPYDNNLSDYGPMIISKIYKGIKSEKIKVIIQADFADTMGIFRYCITNEGIDTFRIDSEKMCYTDTFRNYLLWVAGNYSAKKYDMIFLDHGGKLDKLCLDTFPERKFLRVDSINTVIKEFQRVTEVKIGLLFLQVCAKGSIEPIYELRDCAEYIMFSQNTIKAPNRYYSNVFQILSEDTDLSGDSLAKLIAINDQNYFYSYSCCKTSNLDSFRDMLIQFEEMRQNDSIGLIYPFEEQVIYAEEIYRDIASYLNHVDVANSEAVLLKKQIINFINNELLVFHLISPNSSKMEGYCGISLLSPVNRYYGSYKYLEFFK